MLLRFVRLALWCAFVVGLEAAAFGALTAPSALNTTALKATSFTLRWSAATGGTGGIASYDIYRDGTPQASTATRTIVVAGLAPTTTYNMTVVAHDGGGNVSPASTALAVTTTADTTIPTKPIALSASAVTTTSFSLAWTASTDNVGISGYNIYRSGVLVGSSATTSFSVTGLVASSNNQMTVKAVDAAGNLSAASPAFVVKTAANPPSIPTGLTAVGLKASSVTLKWTTSTGGTGGIVAYDIYQNGVLIGSRTTLSYAITGLTPIATFSMTVVSRDAAGRVSAPSAPLVVTMPADTSKPAAPTGLSATQITSVSFTLMWTPSTDNVGVTSYDIYRGSTLIGSAFSPSYSVTGLSPLSVSLMKVKAKDAAGNISAFSAALSVTTSAIPNVPPTVTLTSPLTGATFTAAATLTLTAAAADSDGTITKIEFFEGATKLGESVTPSSPGTYSIPYTLSSVGLHAFTARATDNRNAMVESGSVAIRFLASLPYTSDFETSEGYVPGPLNNQNGWTVSAGTAQISAADAAHGEQSVVLEAGATATLVDQEFGAAAGNPSPVFFDILAKPVAGMNTDTATIFDIDNARLAFVLNGPVGQFTALDGDGTGAGTWKILSPQLALISGNITSGWQRITVRLDYVTKTWDFYLNGELVATNLKFQFNGATFPSGISVKGHTAGRVWLDDIYVGIENPLFVDSDRDGLADDWELKYLGTLNYGSADDPGMVGRALLASYQGNLSPWPSPVVSDGLRAWFRSDVGVVKGSDNKMGEWADLSGNGFHVGQSDTLRQPTWESNTVNGKPAVHFDGNMGDLQTAGLVDLLGGSDNASIIIVFKPAATQSSESALLDHEQGLRVHQVSGISNRYELLWQALDGSFISGGEVNSVPGQPQIYEVTKEGTSLKSYFNGTIQSDSVTSGDGRLLQMPRRLTIGAFGNQLAHFNGQISEVFVYNRALSDAERLSIEGVLTAAYLNSNGDSDGNGLPDSWEIANFGKIGVDPTADPDGDGLTNLQEYLIHTDPNNAFSSGAGLRDDRLDSDGDGTPDWQEIRDGTNPNDAADKPPSPPDYAIIDLGPNLLLAKVASGGWWWFKRIINTDYGQTTTTSIWHNGKEQIIPELATHSMSAMNERGDIAYIDSNSPTGFYQSWIRFSDGSGLHQFTAGAFGGGASISAMSNMFAIGSAGCTRARSFVTYDNEFCLPPENVAPSYYTDGALWLLNSPMSAIPSALGNLHDIDYDLTNQCGYAVSAPTVVGIFAEPTMVNDSGNVIAFMSVGAGGRIQKYSDAYWALNSQRLSFVPTGLSNTGTVIGLDSAWGGGWYRDGTWHKLANDALWPVSINQNNSILALNGTSSQVMSLFIKKPNAPDQYLRLNVDSFLPKNYTLKQSLDDMAPYFSGLYATAGAAPQINGENAIGAYADFQPTDVHGLPLGQKERRTILLVPATLSVDANRDGIIVPNILANIGGVDPIDQTNAEKPFSFWINDDIDRSGLTVGEESVQDDDDPSIHPRDRDWMLDTIPCERDLEDFARLWISTQGLNAAFANGDMKLGLKWVNVTSSTPPAIKLYRAAEADGGTGYLFDQTIAQTQKDPAGAGKAIAMTPEVGGAATTVIEGPNGFIFPKEVFANVTDAQPKTYLLFEGCKKGTGQLQLVIYDRNGTKIGDSPGIYLDLKNIKEMYERWTVGDGPNPLIGQRGGGDPAPTATISLDRLPSGVSSGFQFGSQKSAEEKNYILFVHGWNMSPWLKDAWAETMFKRLYWQGYKGRFGTFQWPTTYHDWRVVSIFDFDPGEHSAWLSARPLEGLLKDLYGNRSYTVSVLAHSMGNVVTGEALQTAGRLGYQNFVSTYVATQAAVPGHSFDGSLTGGDLLSFGFLGFGNATTPNIYRNWFYLSNLVARAQANFYNVNDYALSGPVWQTDQTLKPDSVAGITTGTAPSLIGPPYGYLGDPTSAPIKTGFFKTTYGPNATGNAVRTGTTSLSLEDLDAFNGSVTNLRDRYEIMAFASQPRSKALGGITAVAGFAPQNLGSLWQPDTFPQTNGPYSAHPWHSAQFRFTNADQANYWNKFMKKLGLPTTQ